jgi:hypothetical protein
MQHLQPQKALKSLGQYSVYEVPIERFEEQERMQARMQEFAGPFSYSWPTGIDVNILEPPRDSECANNRESAKATPMAIVRVLEEHLYRGPILKKPMKAAPAERKRKMSDSVEKAPTQRIKSEKISKMRSGWINSPTEEEVWQIMPTLVRDDGGSVVTPIERGDGTLKCSHPKCGRTYPDMARFKRHANAHINGCVQCPFISRCHRSSLFTRWVSAFVSLL